MESEKSAISRRISKNLRYVKSEKNLIPKISYFGRKIKGNSSRTVPKTSKFSACGGLMKKLYSIRFTAMSKVNIYNVFERKNPPEGRNIFWG